MLLSLFLIVIHLGFASATALASTMIPIVIAVLQSVATPGINVVGMTLLLQFVVSFGFILVVNAPQNMVAYGTDTFLNIRYIAGGAQGTSSDPMPYSDGFTKNWLQLLSVSLGVSLR